VFLSQEGGRLCCNGRVRAAIWLLLVGSFAALSLYARAEGARPADDAVYRWETGIGGIAQAAIVLALLYWLSVGLPRREFFALRRPDSWPRSLGLAFAALVTIFFGAYAIVSAAGAGDEQNLTPEGWDGSRADAYALSFVAIVLVGPFAEELLYRGAGVSLLRPYGAATAVVGTGVLFGLAHGLLLSLGGFVLFGLVTALLRLRTRSIYPSLAVHVTFNALGMIGPLLV
jgi:membrane protease YdiL (CAAX protease family)